MVGAPAGVPARRQVPDDRRSRATPPRPLGRAASRRSRDPDRLRALAETQLDAVPDEAFDRFARLVSDLLDVPVALVSLVSAERQFFPGAVGLPEPWAARRQTPLTHSFCQHVVDIEVPMVLPDARLYPRVRDNLAIEDLGVIAYAGMPTDRPGRPGPRLALRDRQQAPGLDRRPAAHPRRPGRRLLLGATAADRAGRRRGGPPPGRGGARPAGDAGRADGDAGRHAGRQSPRCSRLGHAMVPLLADWCLMTLSSGRDAAYRRGGRTATRHAPPTSPASPR